MIVPKPPINTLVDGFLYYPYISLDDYGKPVFGEEVSVKYARIDRTAKYSIASDRRELLYSAVIFCYAGLTEPFADIIPQSKVVFDGQEHIVTNVIRNQEPYTSDLYSVEIEVV